MNKDLVELYQVDESKALLLRRGDSVGYLVRLIPGEEWNGFPADARALLAGHVDPQWTADLDKMSERKRLMGRPIAEWCEGKVYDVMMDDWSSNVVAYAQGMTRVMGLPGRTRRATTAKGRSRQRPGRACTRRRRRKWDLGPRDRRGLLAYHVLMAVRLAHEAERALTATLEGPASRGRELAELLGAYRDTEDGPLVHPVPAALIDRLERATVAASMLREEAAEAASVVLAALGYGSATVERLSVLDRLSDAFRVIAGEESAAAEALDRMSREVEERREPPVGRGDGDGG